MRCATTLVLARKISSKSAGDGLQHTSSLATRLSQTTKMEMTSLEGMLSAVGDDKSADRVFKKQAWDPILKALHNVYSGIAFEQRQVNKSTEALKEKYCSSRSASMQVASEETQRGRHWQHQQMFGQHISRYEQFEQIKITEPTVSRPILKQKNFATSLLQIVIFLKSCSSPQE